jgi:DnaK suppressor protein
MTTTTAMPRADIAHLSEAPLARLRDRLVRACAHEAAQAHEHRSSASDLIGRTDVDNVLEREGAEEAAINRSNKAIIDIFNAPLRLDAGSYGTCEQCGKPIPSARLEAIPRARLCISCLAVATPQPRRRP